MITADVNIVSSSISIDIGFEQLNYTAPGSASIINSEGTVLAAPTPNTLTLLSDINVYDQDGANPFTASAGIDIQVPDSFNVEAGVGLIPNKPILDFRNITSYFTYDVGWNVANGIYDEINHSDQVGRIQSLTALDTLKYDNIHGNKHRFTDENGATFSYDKTEVYVRDYDVLVQDHLTGYEFAMIQAGNALGSCGGWSSAQNTSYMPYVLEGKVGLTGSYLGKSEWRVPTTRETQAIGTWGLGRICNLAYHLSDTNVWTSEADPSNGRYLFYNARPINDTYRYMNATTAGANRYYSLIVIRDFDING